MKPIKVALWGDSIRQVGYGNIVPKLLGPAYEVWQPDENCRFAKYTLRLAFEEKEHYKDADCIHWNCGLWDCTNLFFDDIFTPYEEYEANILRIAKIFLSITPHVIFATTTPVSPLNPFDSNEQIRSYNERIVPKLKALGVTIDDLFSVIYPHLDTDIRKDDLIHPTESGAKRLANQIAQCIEEEMRTVKPYPPHRGDLIQDLSEGRPIDTRLEKLH
ncbi:MAG: SGNH/GDSL hydrolase family protein [Erysipelotrichaceae bacterium]|nr:SGNH/GDSL hydrolase family protein [Erysipelotrichaceae bacterium]